jgi:putative ATP-grasp target RiPP
MPTDVITEVDTVEPQPGQDPATRPLPGSLASPLDSPLSSASLRYLVHEVVVADRPGPAATRPFGLRAAVPVTDPVRTVFGYSHEQQVAVDSDGRPLIETMGKDWKSKASTDGDEGPEEVWGWEE